MMSASWRGDHPRTGRAGRRAGRSLASAVSVLAVAVLVPGSLGLPPRTPASDAEAAWTAPGEPGAGLVAARAGAGPGAYAAALAQAAAVPPAGLAGLHGWEHRGPTAAGGRLVDLALAPDGTLFAASASGGLWRSDDGGETLAPAWPPGEAPAVGAVAVTAGGVVVAGTGEANAGGGSLAYGGTGVRRSTDGGRTWEDAGLPTSGTVADIEVHPTDPDVLWLAAGGDLFRPGGERGVYRSGDAGRTWQLVLPPATPTTGGADVAVDPADPDHLLAATWDRQRTPDRRRYGGPGSGLHRSTDGGRTWAPVGGGLPGFGADSGRIAVAFSPADGRRLYAVVTRGDGRAGGLWRSDDGGTSWARVDDDPTYEPTQFEFAWWFGRVMPAPEDPDRVLVPGLALLESTDGGVGFRRDALVHADHHDVVWDPADPSRAWLATDGGLYRSAEGGRRLTWTPASVQPVGQVYDVAVPPGAPDAVVAGFQDIGCRSTPGPDDAWAEAARCGDGTQVLAHPERPGEVVVCGQEGRCAASADLGLTTAELTLPDDGRAAWAAPVLRVPGSPDVLLFGGTRVHRSDDAGATWRPISDGLTRGPGPDPDHPFGTLTALAAAPGGGVVAAGTDDGQVWRTDDGGGRWRRVVDGDRWITALALLDDGDLLVATSGYRAGDDAAQVLRVAADGGASTELGTGMPSAPVGDLAVVDDLAGAAPGEVRGVVAATDVGVYVAADLSAPVWRRVAGAAPGAVGGSAAPTAAADGPAAGAALPQVPVTSLDWLAASRQLTAGTYGRGVWRTSLPSLTRHAGADRYATAAAVAATLPPGGGPVTVLVASGEDFPDALAAAAAAGLDPAATRVVLTARGRLPAASAGLLDDLEVRDVVVVGGEAAVGEAVVRDVAARAGDVPVVRVAGHSRYETAAALADLVAARQVDGPAAGRYGDVVVLATAGQPFDALAGAPLAAARRAPVLLVDRDGLPAATADALRRLRPAAVVALGGPAAIGDAVLAEAAAVVGATADRVAGPDRVATAAAATAALGAGDDVWLAGSASAADALAAAATGQPVLLVDHVRVPDTTAAALQRRRPLHVRIAGGPAVVGDAVVAALVG
jgi:putative cell wall-binding protein/photosystem II stability/assembly factor-like uncharacterized protein